MKNIAELKTEVRDYWDEESCGEVYAAGESPGDYYESQRKARYELEPYLQSFAKFPEGKGRDVLEVGVGMGADHIEWAMSEPRSLTGIDLTPRAIHHTSKRLAIYGLTSYVRVGDAEKLPFEDSSFDLVYSWGVLHHSPNTPEAVKEVFRVLRPGGIARVMIYHKFSLTGYLLWVRYALFEGHPYRSLSDIYANHLESPGTKAYTTGEARAMFGMFSMVNIRTELCLGDLLQGAVGQRHGGMLLTTAKNLWPRWLIKRIAKNHGLNLLIEAKK